MDIQYHYTYKVTLPETGEYYLGVRTSKVEPKIDNYMGSMVTWKVNKKLLVKEILQIFETREEANKSEEEIIIYHKKVIKDIKCKNARAGKGSYCTLGVKLSEETKNKISKANKGKLAGIKNPRYGVKLSDEIKKKLREANLGRKDSEETNKKKGNIQSEEKKKMMSNLMKGNIYARVNKGKSKSDEMRNKLTEFLKSDKNTRCKKVIADGVEYYSISNCSEILGITKWFIKKNINNESKINWYYE